MSTTSTCDNPNCHCDPCTCTDCKCGTSRLGDLERRVMDILWAEPGREFTARAVADLLPDHAYTTVATVLDRLSNKGLVRRRKDGRVIHFATTATGAVFTALAMQQALDKATDRDAALVQFAQSISAAEVQALQRALATR